MMNTFLKKVKKAPWVLAQPLTKKPNNPQLVISDLFVWRCNQDWNTYFELLDLASLFGDEGQHQANIVFFDDNGEHFYQQLIELSGLNRQVLDISKVLSALKQLPSDYGTFCIFHKKVPNSILKLQSFIAERGYVSYQYKKAPLRSYVHGNFDAIDSTFTPLAGSSFLNRKYNLQYLFSPNECYEIALVNASSSNKRVEFKIVNFSKQVQRKKSVVIKSKQVFLLTFKNLPVHSRLIVKSKMIMARPVVFCFDNDKINIFHG
jgi:hypothetical protein